MTDAARHPVIGLLADLVAIESINPGHDPAGSGEVRVADYVCAWAARRGLEAVRQPVLPGGRDNVLISVDSGRPGRHLLLEAHMDTVTVTGMTIPPFRPDIAEGRLYGRGACDVKAGLAAMMFALEQAAADRGSWTGRVTLAAAVDEEFGFRGAVKLAETLRADGAVVAEPTGNQVVTAHRGALRFQVTAHGRAAHSSKPHLGCNAITAMARVILHLDDALRARLADRVHPLCGPASAIISLIKGGVQVNWVPPECTIDVELRTLPGQDGAELLDFVRRTAAGTPGLDPDIRIEAAAPYLDSASLECPPDAAVARAALEAAGQAAPVGAPYGTDAGKLAKAGIPSVVVGPGSIDQAHGAVEWVELEQVIAAVELYGRVLRRFGGAV